MTATRFRLLTQGRINDAGKRIRIPYKAYNGYPQFHFTNENCTATDKYIIRAQDVEAFFLEYLPNPSRWRPPEEQTPTPWLHHDIKFWEYPPKMVPGKWSNQLRVVDLTFEPLSADLPADPLEARKYLTTLQGERRLDEATGLNAIADPDYSKKYQDCYLVTINYDCYPFFQHNMSVGGQFLAVDAHDTYYAEIAGVEHETGDDDDDWKFTNAVLNTNIQLPMYINRPTVEHRLFWSWISDPNFEEINKHLGKVNAATFRLLNDATPNTCLFMGYRHRRINTWVPSVLRRPDATRDIFFRDIPAYEIELHFSEMATVVISEDENGNQVRKTYGYNHVYDTHQNKWVYVTRNDDNEPIYQTYNFDNALKDWPGVEFDRDIADFFK